jgi:hypothetical protein
MFRAFRVVVLLLVLATVAQAAWLSRSRAAEWRSSLQVAVFPLVGDARPATAAYVARLEEARFDDIENFVEREARRWGITTLRPIEVSLGARIARLPPLPPAAAGPLDAIRFSLELRWWAWRNTPQHAPAPQIRLFVIFHDPDHAAEVPHSLGLEKGMIGVVHAFAGRDFDATNNVVIAHELLHTVGATDKYDPRTNQPKYPEGYAEPQREPLHPQPLTEIMGGRRALSPDEASMPDRLEESVVGPLTAREIGWLR